MQAKIESDVGPTRQQRRNAVRRAKNAAHHAVYDRRCADMAQVRAKAEEEEQQSAAARASAESLQARRLVDLTPTWREAPATLQGLLHGGGLQRSEAALLRVCLPDWQPTTMVHVLQIVGGSTTSTRCGDSTPMVGSHIGSRAGAAPLLMKKDLIRLDSTSVRCSAHCGRACMRSTPLLCTAYYYIPHPSYWQVSDTDAQIRATLIALPALLPPTSSLLPQSSSQVRSGQVKSSQVRSSQVKSSQVKSSQVKSSAAQGRGRGCRARTWSSNGAIWPAVRQHVQ